MFQSLLSSATALGRHLDAPFAVERERYLKYCFDSGATRAAIRVKSNEILWAARLLDADASCGVDIAGLQKLVERRTSVYAGRTTRQRFIEITRPWLRFLGWWREPDVVFTFQPNLDQYCRWMNDERGFSAATVTDWRGRMRLFLQWLSTTGLELSRLQPSDIDRYFIEEGGQRWNRVSVFNTAAALRVFLRYAATQQWCDSRLAQTIRSPRIYNQESLSFAPSWTDVQRILADAMTDNPRDVRDRAILMLLSIYGLRASEVASLRLDQLDWQHRVVRIFRLKRRQPQVYPLLPTVAEALARYIDTVRPQSPHPEVFIGLNSPRRPLGRSGIYTVVSPRFLALGIQVAHRGPHALRHACAARLVAEGLTLKEIGDHLGHRSTSATSAYAKIDLVALREVGDFDLGDLQ